MATVLLPFASRFGTATWLRFTRQPLCLPESRAASPLTGWSCQDQLADGTSKHPTRYEAVAGHAVALAHLGRPAEGVALVQAVLTFVETHDLVGIVEPLLLLLRGATVLCGAGATGQATAALQRAAAWVELVAGRISSDRTCNSWPNALAITDPWHTCRRSVF